MLKELKHAILFTAITMPLFGAVYPLVLWGVGRVGFPTQAEGSLIRRSDGSIAGSLLIAQAFSQPQYFHPRPSAVEYNAAGSGGSNLAASNPDQQQLMQARLVEQMTLNNVSASEVPPEMVTASGAGLDPHIPPDAAELQIGRVARARGVAVDRVRDVVRAHTQPPMFGFLGRARVNVLALNMALDERLK